MKSMSSELKALCWLLASSLPCQADFEDVCQEIKETLFDPAADERANETQRQEFVLWLLKTWTVSLTSSGNSSNNRQQCFGMQCNSVLSTGYVCRIVDTLGLHDLFVRVRLFDFSMT